jgi:hypothetical protein
MDSSLSRRGEKTPSLPRGCVIDSACCLRSASLAYDRNRSREFVRRFTDERNLIPHQNRNPLGNVNRAIFEQRTQLQKLALSVSPATHNFTFEGIPK